jgi:hypothetical protein
MPLDKRQRAYIWDMQNAATESVPELQNGLDALLSEEDKEKWDSRETLG